MQTKAHGTSHHKYSYFFFQNKIKTQAIWLVSTFSKLFSKITYRVQGTRFCCAKLNIINSSSVKLELQRLNFQEAHRATRRRSKNPKTKKKPKPKNTKKKPKQNHEEITNGRDQTKKKPTKKVPMNPNLLNPNRFAQSLGSDGEGS